MMITSAMTFSILLVAAASGESDEAYRPGLKWHFPVITVDASVNIPRGSSDSAPLFAAGGPALEDIKPSTSF